MIDENGVELYTDEPSPEDFEAADGESPPAGPGAVFRRALRTAVALFVVVALLVYFVVPIRVFVTGVVRDLQRPDNRMRPIPVAPEPTSNPVIRL